MTDKQSDNHKLIYFHIKYEIKGSLQKKKTAYFVTLDQKVGGYLFQNIISFEEEIVTYV